MYNRYIPSADGTYRRQTVPTPGRQQPPQSQPMPAPTSQSAPKPPQTPPQEREPRQPPFKGPLHGIHLDTGDLLVLLILLLVLTEGEDSDPLSALVTLAAFLLLQ